MFNREEKIRILREKEMRGKQADELLATPMLANAIAAMESDVINIMKSLKPSDVEGRDTAWRELRAVARFKQKLESYMKDGKIARQQINQLDR